MGGGSGGVEECNSGTADIGSLIESVRCLYPIVRPNPSFHSPPPDQLEKENPGRAGLLRGAVGSSVISIRGAIEGVITD